MEMDGYHFPNRSKEISDWSEWFYTTSYTYLFGDVADATAYM
jgi:hypothetical protein